MKKYAAVDLGADSGRIIVGTVGEIEEVHRFKNGPVRLGDSIFWNFLGLFDEIKKGLTAAFAAYGSEITSIGIDTWGVDYALLDSDGDLISNPYHYRDDRTDGIADEVFSKISFDEIYEETGIQFMQINSLFQLYAFKKKKPALLEQAASLLTVPCLLNYWLTGVRSNEFSSASTTQLYNPRKGDWSDRIIDLLGFDRSIFSRILPSGARLGPLLPSVAREIGASESVEVIATGSHDTASAVTAVPAPGAKNYAYISSGTWSLLGIETPEPIINEKSRTYNFTNEGAANGGIRFLKNIMGLWILQESKRHWESEGDTDSYDDLMRIAADIDSSPFELDVDDTRFLKPGVIDDDMPARIRRYCSDTGQPSPVNKAETVRGIYEGLARAYAKHIRDIEEITGGLIDSFYIVGGGSSDTFLSQLTATSTGIPVFSGPKEATAIGNILIQAIAMGDIPTYNDGRRMIRDVYPIAEFSP